MKIETENLISVANFAGLEGVTTKSVYEWIHKKQISVTIIDGKQFVNKTDILDKIQKGVYKDAVKLWFEFYEKRVGVKPYFSQKEIGNLKNLLKYLNDISDNKGLILFETILQQWDKLDPFIKRIFLGERTGLRKHYQHSQRN